MARGRRAVPDEIKEMKGNPGKRKLALDQASGAAAAAASPRPALEMPAFLTQDGEKQIFKTVIEDYLQRRIARPSDLNAYARWASYLFRWMSAKQKLDGKDPWYLSESNHGKLWRRHPLFKDMLDLERVLQTLEDRLGLNPVARQNIIRGLQALPAPLGGLFGSEPTPDAPGENEGSASEPPTLDDVSADVQASAMGFLTQPGAKPH